MWIAVSCSVKLFPNLEAALNGVFNRVLHFFPKASEHSFRLKRAFQRTLQFSSCRAQQRRRGRPPCRRQARTRDRAVTACALSHGTIAARGARPRPAAYQPALRVKFTMKVCKRTQQRWSGLLSCALSSKCVLPSVTHCGPTLSRTPTRATSTPSYVPSVALIGLHRDTSTLPHSLRSSASVQV